MIKQRKEKHQGARTDLTCGQNGHVSKSLEEVGRNGEEAGK